MNVLIDLVTMIKKIQLNYQENNGVFLPGYTPSVGFAGTFKPSAGFTFGSQAEIRNLAARNGWLTLYPEFNEQYTEVESKQLDIQANLVPIKDLKIDQKSINIIVSKSGNTLETITKTNFLLKNF